MKRYPKKYYASSMPSSSFSGQRSTLWGSFVSTNTLSSIDVAYLIHQQIHLKYASQNSFVHSILVWYDTLTSSCLSQSVSFASISAAFCTTQSHLQSLWLLDKHTLCISSCDLTYRFGAKKMFHYLYEAWYLIQQKVSYFWDFTSGVSVTDHEVQMVPRPCSVHRIRCFIDSKKDSLLVHIIEPYVLFGAVAVAVNPQDRRYRKLVGKKIIIPLINRIVPIVADDTVSSDIYNGIKLVVPCHDRASLAIAQRHHLPIDVFAIDAYGVFTHHAAVYTWKPYKDFSDNIIQYLQDIHNYDGVDNHIVDVPFCSKTNRYLGYFLTDWRVVSPDISLQDVSAFVWSDSFVAWSVDKGMIVSQIENMSPIVVSSSHGVLGVGYTWAMRDTFTTVASYYTDKKLSDNPILAMIIYDMIYDCIIPSSFVLEHCIDALFSASTKKDILLWKEYCDFLSIAYKDNKQYIKQIDSLVEIFDQMMQSNPDAMHTFADMVDNCAILQQKNNHYILWPLTIASHTFISPVFYDAIHALYLRTMQYWDGSTYYISDTTPYDIEKFVLIFMLHESIALSQPTVYVTTSLSNIWSSWSLVSECIKPLQYYTLDTVRLALVTHTLADLPSQELIIQKIRNVCRYVYMHVIASWMVSHVSWIDVLSSIQDDYNQLTPFDQRILNRFIEISTKFVEPHDVLFPLEQRIGLLHSCIIDDFAVKYIEVTKQRKWPLSHWVMLLCVSMICDMIAPITPSLIWGVRQLFGDAIVSVHPTLIRMPSKNYKIHLLMMIIGGLRNLKAKLMIKNHQKVDICIQWSTDVSWFIQEHRSLLDAVVGVHSIVFLSQDQDIDASYLQEYVVDIALGLKLHATEPSDIDRLSIMYKEKSEYLQHLRALISTWSYPDKELKLEKLKEELQDIEYQLLKAKQSW